MARTLTILALCLCFAAPAAAAPKLSVEVDGPTTVATAIPVPLRVVFSEAFTGSVQITSTDNESTFTLATLEFAAETEQTLIGVFTTAGKQEVTVTVASGDVKGKTSIVTKFTVVAGSASALEILTPDLVEAGSTVELTIAATDAYGNAATDFGGAGTLTFQEVTYSFVMSGGTATVTLAPTRFGTDTAYASIGDLEGTVGVSVLPGAISALERRAGHEQTVPLGGPFDTALDVQARDALDNPVPDATVRFRIDTGGVSLTADTGPTLVNAVLTDSSGRAQTQGTGDSLGAFAIVAEALDADGAVLTSITFTGEVALLVDHFTFEDLPTTLMAGGALTDATVTARAASGVVVDDFSATLTLDLGGAGLAPNDSVVGQLSASLTFTAGVASLHDVVLFRAGTATLGIDEPTRGASGSAGLTVTPGPATALSAGDYAATVVAGKTTSLTGQVVDTYGNAVSETGRTIELTIDSASPGDGTFTEGQASPDPGRAGAVAVRVETATAPRVHIVGGTAGGEAQATTFVYHPSVHAIEPGPSLAAARMGHTATALTDGAVLVFGGAATGEPVAELLTVAVPAFVPVEAPVPSRTGHQAVLLPDGKVLILGGVVDEGAGPVPTKSTLIYDPAAGDPPGMTPASFSPGPDMPDARTDAVALVVGGKVYVVGGIGPGGPASAVWTYDTEGGGWSVHGTLLEARSQPRVVLFDDTGDGTLLIVGGKSADGSALATAELYDLASGSASPTGSLPAAQPGGTLTRYGAGKAIYVGGTGIDDGPIGLSWLFRKTTTGTVEVVAGPQATGRHNDHIAFPNFGDDGEVVILLGNASGGDFFRAPLANAGTFPDGTKSTTVTTGPDGSFPFDIVSGLGAQTVAAVDLDATPLEPTSWSLEGARVPIEATGIEFVAVAGAKSAGAIRLMRVLVVDSEGERVRSYSGFLVLEVPGAAPEFASQLLVRVHEGAAGVPILRFARAGFHTLNAYLLENPSISAQSDPVEVVAAAEADVVFVGGDGATALPLSQLPDDDQLAAVVLDPFGNPVAGVPVTFTAVAGAFPDGSLTLTVTSGSDGVAVAAGYTAPAEPGLVDVFAAIEVGEEPFVAEGVITVPAPVDPESLVALTPVVAGPVDSAVTLTFRATSLGRPVAGVAVSFTKAGGPGTLTAMSGTTDGKGEVSVGVLSSVEGRTTVLCSTTDLTPTLSDVADALHVDDGKPAKVKISLPTTTQAGSEMLVDFELQGVDGAPVGGDHTLTFVFDGVSYAVVLVDGKGSLVLVPTTAGDSSYTVIYDGPSGGTSAIAGVVGGGKTTIPPGAPASITLDPPSISAIPIELIEAGRCKVKLLDAEMNPVDNYEVLFEVTAGDSAFLALDMTGRIIGSPKGAETALSDDGGVAMLPSMQAGGNEGEHTIRVSTREVAAELPLTVVQSVTDVVALAFHERPAGPEVNVARLAPAMPGETLARPPALVDLAMPDSPPVADSTPKVPSLVVGVEVTRASPDGEGSGSGSEEPTPEPVCGAEVEYTVLQSATELPSTLPATAFAGIDKAALIPGGVLYEQRTKRIFKIEKKMGDKTVEVPIGGDALARAVAVLGTRTIVRTDAHGQAGMALSLRVPRNWHFEEGVEDASPLTDPYIAVRVRFLPRHRRLGDDGEEPDSETLYLLLPVRQPDLVLSGGIPSTEPFTMIAGTAMRVGPVTAEELVISDFPKISTYRPAPRDSAGLPPASDIEAPNVPVFSKIYRKLSSTAFVSATDGFHVNWRQMTTSRGDEDPLSQRLMFVPRKTIATTGTYRIVFSTDAAAPAADPASESFEIVVTRDFPAPFAGPAFFTSGAFQRKNLPTAFDSSPAKGLPDDLTFDFSTLSPSPSTEKFDKSERINASDTDTGPHISTFDPLTTTKPKWKALREGTGESELGWGVNLIGEDRPMGEPPTPTRARAERALGIDDYRIRVVRKTIDSEGVSYKPVDTALLATDVLAPDGTALAAESQFEYYVEVRMGDAGDVSKLRLLLAGLSLLEARDGAQRPLLEPTVDNEREYFFSATQALQARLAAPARVQDFPLSTVEVGTGERVVRFGPLRLTNQTFSAVRGLTERVEEAKSKDLVGVGGGLAITMVGRASGEQADIAAVKTLALPVNPLALSASNGGRDFPLLSELRAEVAVIAPAAIKIGDPVAVRIRDRVSDISKAPPTKFTYQVEQDGLIVVGPVVKTTFDPWTGELILPISLGGASSSKSATLKIRVVNALGNTSELLVDLSLRDVTAAGATHDVNTLFRTPVVEPTVVRLVYEAPAVTALATSFPATLEVSRAGTSETPSAMPLVVSRANSKSTVYLSQEVIVGLGSAELANVMGIASGDILVAKTTSLPFGPKSLPAATSLAPGAAPVFKFKDADGTFTLDKTTLEEGDEFKVIYQPDSQLSDIKSILVKLGPIDGSGQVIDSTALIVRLVAEPAEDGAIRTFSSQEVYQISYDPTKVSDGSTTLYLTTDGQVVGVQVLDETEAFPIPTVQLLTRHTPLEGEASLNQAEAMSGNSPQAGSGVYVHNREHVLRLDLHSVPASGLSYRLAITHRSRTHFLTPVGDGWTHNYDLRLRLLESGAEFYNGDGRAVRYSGADFTPEPGVYVTLAAVEDKYTLTSPDKTVMTFTAQSYGGFRMIETIVDSNGNTLRFSYTDAGRLFRVTDPFGREYRYHYDSDGRLSKVVDFRKREINFVRDPNTYFAHLDGVLLPQVTLGLADGAPARSKIDFIYDALRRLTGASTHNGPLFVNKYASSEGLVDGRIARQEIGDRVAYSSGGGTKQAFSHFYTFANATSKGVPQVRVSKSDRMTQVYAFAARAHDGASFSALGTVAKLTVPSKVTLLGAAPETTHFGYNEQLELTLTQLPRGNKLIVRYDDASTSVHKRGNVLRRAHRAASTTEVNKEAILRLAAASGYTTNGPKFLEEIKAAIKQAHARAGSELVTTFTYANSAFPAKVTGIVRPDGTTIDHLYDAKGNRIQTLLPTHDPSGTKGGVRGKRTWVYNAAGQVVKATVFVGKTKNGEDVTRVTRFFYFKRTSGDTFPSGLDPLVDANITDATGDKPLYLARVEDDARKTRTHFERDDRGNITATIDARGVVTRRVFNERDDVVDLRPGDDLRANAGSYAETNTITPVSNRPHFTYRYDGDGNRLVTINSSTGSGGHVCGLTSYDSLKRVTSTSRQFKGSTPDPDNLAVSKTFFDAAGMVDATVDPEGIVTRHIYDDKLRLRTRRVVGTADGAVDVESFMVYDLNGNLIWEQTGAGARQARLTFYDGFDRPIATLAPGRCEVSDGSDDTLLKGGGALTVQILDNMGRAVETGVYGLTLSYSDAEDKIADRFTIEFGRLSHVERDFYHRGWLRSESIDPRCFSSEGVAKGKVVRQYTYNQVGEILQTSSSPYGPTVVRTYTMGRLRTLAKGTEFTIDFDYDKAGNLVRKTEKPDGRSFVTTRTYDILGRVHSETMPGDATDKPLTNTLTYDYRGNMVESEGPQGTREVTYDLANRETSQTVNDLLMGSRTYRRNGQIASRTDPRGNTTSYSFYDNGMLRRIAYPRDSEGRLLSRIHTYEASTGYLTTIVDRDVTIALTVDDAGQVLTRRATGGELATGLKVFCHDALGRVIIASETAGAFGESTAVYTTYDGLGRKCTEGHQIDVSGGPLASKVFGRPKVARIVRTTHYDGGTIDSSGKGASESLHSLVEHVSSGMKVKHFQYRSGLSGKWETHEAGRRLTGHNAKTADGLPSSGYYISASTKLGLGGSAASWRIEYNARRQVRSFSLTRNYLGQSRTLESGFEMELEYHPDYGVLLRKTRGLEQDASLDKRGGATSTYYSYMGKIGAVPVSGGTVPDVPLLGPRRPVQVVELQRLHRFDGKVQHWYRRTTNMRYTGTEQTLRTVKQEDLVRKPGAPYEGPPAFESSHTVPDPATSISGLNQVMRALNVTPAGTTDTVYTYDRRGNLTSIHPEGSAGSPSLELTWDSANRLRTVVARRVGSELVYKTPPTSKKDKKKKKDKKTDKDKDPKEKEEATPVSQTVTRVATLHFVYSATGMRLLKTVQATSKTSGPEIVFDRTITKAIWPTRARGTVVEDTTLARRVETFADGSGSGSSTPVTTDIGTYQAYPEAMGVTQAIQRWVNTGGVGGIDGIVVTGFDFAKAAGWTFDKAMFVLRDEANSPLSLVDSDTGLMVADYGVGFDGAVTEVQNSRLAPLDDVERVCFPYAYLGGEIDEETGLQRRGVRYQLRDLQRYISLDPMGIWFDAGAFGNGYSAAAGNPISNGDASGNIAFTVALVMAAAIVAEGTQSDTLAMLSPVHAVKSGIFGTEPFSGKPVTAGERALRLLGGAAVFAGPLASSASRMSRAIGYGIDKVDNIASAAASAGQGDLVGFTMSIIGVRQGSTSDVARTSRSKRFGRSRRARRNAAGGPG